MARQHRACYSLFTFEDQNADSPGCTAALLSVIRVYNKILMQNVFHLYSSLQCCLKMVEEAETK